MKRWLTMLMCCVLLLSLAACGGKGTVSEPDDFNDFSIAESDPELSSSTSQGDKGTKPGNTTTTRGSGSVKNDVSIADGDAKLEDTLDLKGKTVYISCGISDETTRIKKAFEKKYGCTVEMLSLDFDKILQQIAARNASGDPLDVFNLHGSKFPTAAISNLLEPLQKGLTTADYYNAANKAAGGIDMERSAFFEWNNNLYAVVNHTGLNSVVGGAIFYNKKMLQAAGCDDPRTLYNEGKWNWEAMRTIGKKVTDSSKGVYLGKAQLVLNNMVSTNGATYVLFNNGTPKENLSDQKIFNALTVLKEMCNGTDKIIDIDDYSSDGKSFYQGKIAFFTAAKYNYYNNFKIAEGVLGSNAFGKSLDNLGIVPFPLGPDNAAGVSGIGPWAEGWAAAKGTKDVRVTVAWAKFCSTYNDPVKPKYTFKPEDEALFAAMEDKTVQFRYFGFADSTKTVSDYIRKLEENVAYGGDVAQNLKDYSKIISNCIKITLSQQ